MLKDIHNSTEEDYHTKNVAMYYHVSQSSTYIILNGAVLWSDFNFNKWQSMILTIKVDNKAVSVLMVEI